MKISLILLGLVLLISCTENQKYKWCKEGIEKAEREIENEGLIFVKYLTLGGGSDRYDEELKQLLNKSKIRFQYEVISCAEFEKEAEIQSCYQKTMLERIENKFGEDYIEKISNQSDTMFANRKNYVFEYIELDETPYFINSKGKDYSGEELIKYLNKHLRYPNEYKLAKTVEERPFVELKFIVDKDGRPKEFQISNSAFHEEKEKFRDYFEREVLRIMSEIPRWELGKIHGKKVDTKFTKRIPLDWII